MVTSRVIKKGDARILEINGAPALSYGYLSYQPENADYEAMHEAGVKLFFLPVYAGDRGINPESGTRPFYDGFWVDENKYDFHAAEEVFRSVIGSAKPGEIYVIPRVMLEVPLFWEKLHPEELARDFAGESVHQSYSSEVWFRDADKALHAFCAWLRESGYDEYVAGIHVAAGHTEEFIRPQIHPFQMTDYSIPSVKAWREWLRETYKTADALSDAWDFAVPDFDNAPVPTPAQRLYTDKLSSDRNPQARDYYRFHSYETARALCRLAGSAKRALGGNRVVGAFYAYCGAEKGHTAVELIMNSPDVDFLASPFVYKGGRPAAGDWVIGGPIDSCALHNKLWFMECDVRTHLSRTLAESMPRAVPAGGGTYYSSPIWSGPDEKTTLWQLKKVLGKNLSHGSSMWWFDMWGGWYRSAAYADFHKRAIEIYRNIMKDFRVTAQTAVVCQHSADETQVNAPDRCDALNELALTGAAFRQYEMCDLKHVNPNDFRALVLINVYTLSDEETALIHGWMRDGRSVITMNCPAFKPPETDINHVIDLGTAYVYRDCQVYEFDWLTDVKALREALLMAGVHIYAYTGDVIYACRGMVTINAVSGGMKKLYLPRRGTLIDAFTEEKLTPSEHFTYFTMEEGETRMFLIEED